MLHTIPMPLFLMFGAFYEEILKKYQGPAVVGFTAVLLGLLTVTMFMVGQPQDIRQRAAEPTPMVCATPPPCPAGSVLDEVYPENSFCPIYSCMGQ